VTLRFEDLPASVRAQIAGQVPDVSLTRRKRPRAEVRGPGRWRCHVCGVISTSWAAATRHSDEERHCRIDDDAALGVVR